MPEYEAAGEAAREEAAREAAGRWHALAAGPQGADMVLLDGFHALKHALRFGADVPLAVAEDRPAALALAAELAPDLAPRLAGLLVPVPPALYRSLVPRPHPTGVAALAARPPAAGFTGPRTSPLLVLDEPRNLGNTGAVIRLAAGFGASGVVTTGALDPWHPAAVRAGAGLHFALPVARRAVPGLPAGPL
ncbi:rRNA methylase, partial [Streptomyces sp. SPB074]